jgi:hypothetical protein
MNELPGMQDLISDMEQAGARPSDLRFDTPEELADFINSNPETAVTELRQRLDAHLDESVVGGQDLAPEQNGSSHSPSNNGGELDIASPELEAEIVQQDNMSVGKPTEMPNGELVAPSRDGPMRAGNEFNAQQRPVHANQGAANELHIVNADGTYSIVDTYNPQTGEIISRKFTQLGQIDPLDALGYLQELRVQYPPGAPIRTVPSTPGALVGEQLAGFQILEVPVQTTPIPESVLSYAEQAGITIRDTAGTVYTL